ncbi:GNAT family N-acetyltransferase [Streptomyces sp. P38-E01]|uniref:GNAT family N-acetyltransferase n=1 Tax=Streptomyces tardus TaxID=2780544 RepID=A0A949JFE1_9ACTN|nr:GNAT family N-acetyltransferase [Streptomyces tardus]MBU7599012.1 GNAT family N-acetyltransferase [Streptomyces tardus]
MPQLTRPTVEVRDSFLGAMDEFREEAGDWFGGNSMIAEEVRVYGGCWTSPEGFAEYVADVRAAAENDRRPANWVAATVLWYVDGTRWLGRIALRHEYTRHLLEQGGLIGYEVRPTARRRGHATAMLRDALPFAAERGFDRVLITCDADNVASRKVIESCGGALEDRRGKKLRYWVPTAPA